MNFRIVSTTLTLLVLATHAYGQKSDFREIYSKIDTLENIRSKVFNGPVSPKWTGDSIFIYRNREAQGDAFYEVDLSRASRKILSKEEYESRLSGTTGVSSGRQGWRRPDRISAVSPDGKFEAYIEDYNVHMLDNSSGERTQLSFDGTEQFSYISLHWSPDSRKLASMRRQHINERQIPLRESAPRGQLQPSLRWIDYAKPGDVLEQSYPALFDIEKRSMTDIDLNTFDHQYALHFGRWHPSSDFFTFEYNRRGHQLYQLVAVHNDGSTRIITEERSETFVYYNDLWRQYLPDGNILWISERDDWRHLYHIDTRSGETRQLTKGEWNVREILQVKGGTILFMANGRNDGEDPYNKHLCRLDTKTLEINDLTPENGNHVVSLSPDKSFFTDAWSRPDRPSTSLVRDMEGNLLMTLHSEDISALEKSGWRMPEVFVAKGRDGKTDIWGTIFFPSDYNPRKKYPVVEYIYAGPHDSFVLKDFYCYTRFSKLQELGYIVVTIDGMGTDNRSKSFQDVCWRNLKDSGFPDRILWMQAAARKHRSFDLNRVGIYGYSAGGQSALQALLHHGNFYKVAVSLCGCHDNRMDKIWWNEQWMGYPIGPWYSENSTVDNAHLLQGKLLIINGELDDNVDPASTLQVVKALVDADKDFEQLYLPGYSHNLGDKYVTRKVFEFFYENL